MQAVFRSNGRQEILNEVDPVHILLCYDKLEVIRLEQIHSYQFNNMSMSELQANTDEKFRK